MNVTDTVQVDGVGWNKSKLFGMTDVELNPRHRRLEELDVRNLKIVVVLLEM